MQLTTISEYIRCDYRTFEALRDATSVTKEDFSHQSSFPVSNSFLKAFPPTRCGEPLSGLWDFNDRNGFGHMLAPSYSPPNVDVIWHQDRAWVLARSSDVNTSALTKLIGHICRNYLPISMSWIFHDHNLAPGSLGGSCVLIDESGCVDGDCTWNTLRRWQDITDRAHCADLPETDHAGFMSELVTRIRCHAVDSKTLEENWSKSGIIVAYVPGSAPPHDRDFQYKTALATILKPLRHSYVKCSSTWLQEPGNEVMGYAGSEIAMYSGQISETLAVLQEHLPKTAFVEGTELQYDYHGCPHFVVYTGGNWSKATRIISRSSGKSISSDFEISGRV